MFTELQKTVLINNKIPQKDWVSFTSSPKRIVWPKVGFEDELKDYFSKFNKDDLIVIHGDYDCDGITGSLVMYKFFKHFGYNVEVYLPSRERGYGINPLTIDDYSHAKLMITVDCGISNKNEIEYAKSKGIDVIVTDHHAIPDELPDTLFTFHPKVLKIEKCNHLAGVGVSFWFCKILNSVMKYKGFDFDKWIAAVAIGTIGDLTPLQGFNRNVVKYGLSKMKYTDILGLGLMFEFLDVDPQSQLDEELLAFQVIPRLNASGRLKDPIWSFALLATEDYDGAKRALRVVDGFNKKRKDICNKETEDLEDLLAMEGDIDKPILVVDSYPHGIVGLIAAKLSEKYQVPAFICSKEGDTIRGSARSPEWFNVTDCLRSIGDYLDKFGGHACAAGFSFHKNKFGFVQDGINRFFEKADKTTEEINTVAFPEDMSLEQVYRELQVLKPFGMGNPKPMFTMKNIKVHDVWHSKDGKHTFGMIGENKFSIFFSKGIVIEEELTHDVVFSIMLPNSYNKKYSINIKRIKEHVSAV